MNTPPETLEAARAEIATLCAENALLRERLNAKDQDFEREHAEAVRARRVLEVVPMLIYVYDIIEKCNVYANCELAAFLGYSAEEMQAMGTAVLVKCIHPDDLLRVPAHHARLAVAPDGQIHPIEYRIREPSGEWRWMLDYSVVFSREPDGKVRQILGVIHDITTRKQAEEALRASQDLLQALVDHTPSMVFAKDLQGRCILVNRQLDAFYGVEQGGIIGKRARDVMPPDVARLAEETDRSVIETQTSIQYEEEIPRPNGVHTFLTTKFPIFDSQGAVRAVAAVATDISPQKAAEAARAALQARVIEAQQAVIRELVTPLLPLASGVVAMPLVGVIDPERAQQIIETLLTGIASHQASIAILDVTGVKNIDEQVAQTLVQAAQAAGLLGAQVVLTGIQAQIAQTLVHLGADLRGIVTQATLQSGIAYALRQSSSQGRPGQHFIDRPLK